MTVAVAPEVRAAQRRIVSTINASGRLNADGLALWREVNCGEWKATAADISRDLDLLHVPHTIVTAFRLRSRRLRRHCLERHAAEQYTAADRASGLSRSPRPAHTRSPACPAPSDTPPA
ncbi:MULTISPECIES: hypothetical protein [unclassified Streptomyces]|uniref:hypothetical protein n=1 Tax=unclassified Streptomyces TaxID=2593676 RepID=UPI003443D65E